MSIPAYDGEQGVRQNSAHLPKRQGNGDYEGNEAGIDLAAKSAETAKNFGKTDE
jgi:hypothetical protein